MLEERNPEGISLKRLTLRSLRFICLLTRHLAEIIIGSQRSIQWSYMIRAFVRPFALAIYFTTLLAGVPASANTYTIYNLTTDSYLPMGIDDFGNVLIDTTSNCSVLSGSGHCFELFSQGTLLSRSDTLPTSFVADNGTPCPFSPPSGFAVTKSVCNNGYQLVGLFGPPREVLEFYPGSGPSGDLISGNGVDILFVNGIGDSLIVDGSGDGTIFETLVNTPEPSTLVFFITGALGMVGIGARRFGGIRKQ
jgi:hypothetical protein